MTNMAHQAETIGLDDVLQADTPPEARQLVSYSIETRGLGWNVLHSENCEEHNQTNGIWTPTTSKYETPGDKTIEHLQDNEHLSVCSVCYPDTWSHIELLWGRQQIAGNRPGEFCWADLTLLLCYETHKPEAFDKWCQWANHKTPEQLRKQARSELAWDEPSTETRVVVFEADAGREGWRVGAGKHVPVNRWGLGFSKSRLHGIIPQRLSGVFLEQDTAQSVVEIDETFTNEHLSVAVSLYEANCGRVILYSGDHQTIAEKAVEEALLVLA